MKKFGFAAIAATGLTAAIFGLAAPAQAADVIVPPRTAVTTTSTDLDHIGWINDIQPKVNVPQVDTSPRHHGNR